MIVAAVIMSHFTAPMAKQTAYASILADDLPILVKGRSTVGKYAQALQAAHESG